MIAYVDSSVLLRVVFGEANSLREWKKVTRAVSSQLIVTETLRTLDRVRITTVNGTDTFDAGSINILYE